MSAIVVEHLSTRYGDLAAVDDVSFAVRAGEIVALLGPNGAGKTTTIEILEGYLAPSEGLVSVLGCDPAHGDRAWRARIGLVLQSTSLEPHVTVRAALAAFARLFPQPRSVGEVLELIDLEADADTTIGQLSGGQQRRVDIGLGIVGRPEVLFLDEPTTGLDPAARRRTWAVIEELAQDGTTILLSTHYLEEAERLADRLIVLAGGRLVADARADELRTRAAHTVVRYPLPCDVPIAELPDALAAHVDGRRRELVLRTDDPASVLERLVDWARSRDVDLMGIEVAAPSLEDAYLVFTGQASAGPAVVAHV